MSDFDTSIIKLVGLANFLEQQTDQEESLNHLAALAATMLESENCSIMLLNEEDGSGETMKVFASHGYLPEAAYTEKAKHRQGIAGQVASSGKGLLVNDIENSPYASKARWPERKHKGFMAAPIFIGPKVLGVINVNTPTDERQYEDKDLFVLSTVALVVGKSIQVVQLQNLLKSRFAQIAMMQEAEGIVGNALVYGTCSPARMSKALGKAFYKEMHKAGFGDDHIISAATEVIDLLGRKIKRHQRRRDVARI